MVWTIEQLAIFAWFSLVTATTDLIVRARAGTGKTTTIVEGVKRFVAACIAAGQTCRVLVCAFNKEIATELDSRFSDMKRSVDAKTLHALGFMFVRQAWRGVIADFKGPRAWNLASRACGNAMDSVVKLVADLHTKGREIEPLAESGRDLVNLALQFDLVPDDVMARSGWNLDAICDAAYTAMRYAAERPRDGKIDGADMIYLPLVHGWVTEMYDRVIVDECQDMTMSQLELARRACKASGFMCLVGDDRQAIYGFRGADSGSLDRLKTELGAKELNLTLTYRCGSAIVAMAQKLVPDYQCPTTAHTGEILAMGADAMMSKAAAGDFILSRTNAPLARVCLALLKAGVRAYIRGRDIGAGLNAVVRKLRITDISDLNTALATWHGKQCEVASRMDADKASDRIAMLTDQREVIETLSEGCLSVSELTSRISSMFEESKDAGRVMCATVHKAKGLEASTVYLLDGTFKRSGDEESNIRYVAITRAKHTLALVSGFEKSKSVESLAA